jgi:hypothetical protein
MRPRPAQVAEQLGVGAAGVLQGVGETNPGLHRSPPERTVPAAMGMFEALVASN